MFQDGVVMALGTMSREGSVGRPASQGEGRLEGREGRLEGRDMGRLTEEMVCRADMVVVVVVEVMVGDQVETLASPGERGRPTWEGEV